jgi:hypothetical protein
MLTIVAGVVVDACGTSLTACTLGGSVSGIFDAETEDVKKKDPSSFVVSAPLGLGRLEGGKQYTWMD